MSEIDMGTRVKELQAEQVPVLTWGDILTEGEDGLTEAQKVALDDYFEHFMLGPLDDDGKEVCPCCRERMQGGIEGAVFQMAGMGVSLEWGLAHGEASCSGCGWPYRVCHHNIGGKGDGQIIKRLVVSLPYHPSEIRVRGEVEHG